MQTFVVLLRMNPSVRKPKLDAVRCIVLCTALAAAAMVVTGCGTAGGYVRATIHQYEVGNFNAATRACFEVSQDEDYLNDKAHTRYLVYCGLTHYRLGRRTEAHEMLAQGNAEYLQGRSNWLKPGVVDELYKALDDLDGRNHARPTRESFGAR